ncbi:MAG: hypothetical protein JJU46_12705 [Balneolaceae bacterium]|nr:hypothetical protein [Balneolaceae bacterium]MCH8549542.1 hypothetical protein [Balneolaceae bacterium]
MSINYISITVALMLSAYGTHLLSGSEKDEIYLITPSSDTCYYFVETTLDRGEFWNNRPSLSYLISNVVPASCNSGGGTRNDILNQFNEAVKADGKYADAKLARIAFGPYRSRSDGLRAHRRHIGNYLSNNHVVTDFSFRYYRRD